MPTIIQPAKFKGMPEGTYEAVFVNLKQGIETQFGEKLGWEFEITSPPEYAGRKVQRLTGLETGNEKALCTLYMKWVTGDTESKDVEPFYGKPYQLLLSQNEKGYNVIERVFPKKTGKNKVEKVVAGDRPITGIEIENVLQN